MKTHLNTIDIINVSAAWRVEEQPAVAFVQSSQNGPQWPADAAGKRVEFRNVPLAKAFVSIALCSTPKKEMES